jgi:hypothetical protein
MQVDQDVKELPGLVEVRDSILVAREVAPPGFEET